MEPLKVGDLTIEVAELDTPPLIRLNWLGISNDRQPDKVLSPFFTKVLEAAAEGSRGLALHFEQIERFNSSTILSIIRLIQAARHRKVPLVVVYDPTRKWQRLSFDALRIFDKKDGLFELRPVGDA